MPEPGELIPLESAPIISADKGDLIPAWLEDYSADTPLPQSMQRGFPEGLGAALDKPLLKVPPKLIKGILTMTQLPSEKGGGSDQINEGIANSLSKQIEGITSLKGIAMGAGLSTPLAPLIGGYLGIQGIKGVGESIKNIGEAYQAGDLIKIAEGTVDTLGNVAMVAGGVHAAKPLAKRIHAEATGLRGEQAAIFPSGKVPEARDPKVLGFNPKAEVPSEQLHSRLQIIMPKGEFDMFTELGLKDKLPPGAKVKAEDVASWMEEVGPRIEIKDIPAKNEAPKEYTEATQKLSNLSHEMENLGYRVNDLDEIIKDGIKVENTGESIPPRALELRTKMSELRRVQEQYIDQVQDNDSATARYTQVNPKELENMPGAVDILLKIPKKEYTEIDQAGRQRKKTEDPMYKSGHYPKEGENLLAHVRGYMETAPDGKKTFHVFELQSDWAQAIREKKKTGQFNDSQSMLDAEDHPLLKQYERLAVKAAIEHARKEGADAIAFSDAETAMLTEGHDQGFNHWRIRDPRRADFNTPVEGWSTRELAEEHLRTNPAYYSREATVAEQRPTQEKGMRLHYDQTIPKLAKELTGDEGTVVDFGEHKNAFGKVLTEEDRFAPPLGEQTGQRYDLEQRSDLIFRNPSGTPKITITARSYRLAKARPEFTMFGSDKPPRGMQIQAALDKNREAGFLGISGPKVPSVTRPINGRTLVPDLLAKDVANLKHGTLFGIEKNLILGRLSGGKRRIMDKYDAPIASWYAEEYGVGPALTSAYAEQIRGEVKGFELKDGKLNLPGNPTPRAAFRRLMADPLDYTLTKEQQATFNNIIKPTLERMVETSRANSIPSKRDPFRMNKAVGKNLEEILVDTVAKQYSKVAMARLRADPKLIGTSFKRDIAPELQARGDRALRTIGNVNSFIKAMRLGYDFGVGQIQLLPTAFSHPTVWAKAQTLAIKSFFNEGYFTAYARRNLKDIQAYAQEGGSIGRLEEYREGLGAQGQLTKALEKLPVIGTPAAGITKAFGRHFQVALDVAKIELWKAFKDVYKNDPVEHQKMVRLVESMTLSGRMESAGVHHSRAIWERALFNAPSYYRGAVEFIGAMAEGGVTGQKARSAMGKFVLGSTAMYYGVSLALGMDEEEIQRRLNPKSSKFMMWTTDDEDGQKLNFGIGNIYRSVLRMFGGIADTITNQDKSLKDFKSLSSDRNPVARFLRGHTGPIPSAIWDSATDRDYLGLKADIGNNFIGQGLDTFVPMVAQPGASMKERGLQAVGLNAFKGGLPTAQEVAKKLFDKSDVDKLTLIQRAQVQKEAQRLSPGKSLAERELASQRAHDNEYKRLARVEVALTDGQKEWLTKNKLNLPSFELKQSVQLGTKRLPNSESIPMGKEQGQKYEVLVTQYYKQEITKLMGSGLTRLPQEEKQKVFSKAMATARERARTLVR